MLSSKTTVAVCGLALVAAALITHSGCSSTRAQRARLVSPYPLDRVEAAVRLAEAGDAGAVDLLIRLLDDRDRAVRMYAILALERLFGTDYGYRYYDPQPERAAAIARWQEARQRGELTVGAHTPDSGELTTSAAAEPEDPKKAQSP